MTAVAEYEGCPARTEVTNVIWQNLVEATPGKIGIRDSFLKTIDEADKVFASYQRR